MTLFQVFLYGAALCYLLSGYLVVCEIVYRKLHGPAIAASVLSGAGCIAAAIALRWSHSGQGPFLTLYEILISSLFSLGLIYGFVYWRSVQIRASAPFALAVILLLLFWTANTNPGTLLLPPTYETPWLWVHVVSGKLFLGFCLVAASSALLLLLPAKWLRPLTDLRPVHHHELESLIWRWFSLAFVFHCMMLISGAVWAQDAWGRFWDWDPLETWAFATWLVMAAGLHVRSAFRVSRKTASVFVVGAFLMAFLTFFGVPFISTAPHQGAV